MWFLVIAFVFGLASGWIGRLKGGSFLIWFIVGAALPGVGILAALFMRNEKTELRRHCPECGSVLPISDQVCMRCGHDLDFPERAEPAGNPV